jgi:hypothetical protein
LLSDVKRTTLLAECKELEKKQEKGKDVTERLKEVYTKKAKGYQIRVY